VNNGLSCRAFQDLRDASSVPSRGARGLALTVGGLAIGVVLALSSARPITTLLYGFEPSYAGALAAVSAILVAVAMLASFVPARRGSRCGSDRRTAARVAVGRRSCVQMPSPQCLHNSGRFASIRKDCCELDRGLQPVRNQAPRPRSHAPSICWRDCLLRVRCLQRGRARSGRRSPKLQIMLVASPRNQLYLDQEVAGIWRPLAVSGRVQHSC
jgi:hypothetical protein